jgi:hypothetical protein
MHPSIDEWKAFTALTFQKKQQRFHLFSLQTQNGKCCVSSGSVTLVFVANCFEEQHMRLTVSH